MRLPKILLLAFFPLLLGIARLEDLDKSPIGAYQGQILFGANISFGFPFGSLVSAEENFTDGTVYTFTDAEVTKSVAINHFSSNLSLFGEYIVYDHFGARLTFDKNSIVQRSAFGKDLNNENEILYEDIAFRLAPVYHLTVRTSYDVAIAPFLGASFGTLYQAPVSASLFDEIEERKVGQTALFYGIDISAVYYFKGGFFLNAGITTAFYGLRVEPYTRVSPSPEADYNGGKKDALLGNILFYFGGGYALFN